MGNMGTWVVSLLGIAVITLICDVILPQGQTSKYIKTVTSLIVVCCVVFPLATSFVEFDWKFASEDSDVFYQQEYLDFVKLQKEAVYSSHCERVLNENGYSCLAAVVNLDSNLKVESVSVYLDIVSVDQAVIDSVAKLIATVVDVKKESIYCVAN